MPGPAITLYLNVTRVDSSAAGEKCQVPAKLRINHGPITILIAATRGRSKLTYFALMRNPFRARTVR